MALKLKQHIFLEQQKNEKLTLPICNLVEIGANNSKNWYIANLID